MKLKINNTIKPDLIAFLFFLLVFYSIFRISDSFNKGYNIVEDHLIIITNQSIESKPIISVFKEMIKFDMEGIKRFRPFYIVYVITTIGIFGVNLLYINIYIYFLCIITAFFLFKFCSNVGFSFTESILFPLLTLIGPSTVMYIRPPDNEIIGMLMVSLTLIFLSCSIYSTKNIIIYKSLFLFFLFICAFCKESFLLLVPAIIFLYLCLYGIKNNTSIIYTIKENKLILSITGVFTIVCLFIITKYIGLGAERYSGVNSNFLTIRALTDFLEIVFKTKMFLLSLLGILVYLGFKLYKYKFSINSIKNSLSIFTIPFIFLILVILPQFILYYKTGFEGRYYLPFLMGFSFLLIFVLKVIFVSNFIPKFIKYSYFSIIFVLLIFTLINDTIPELTKFSKMCRATSEVLNTLINTNGDFLIVLDPVQNFNDLYSLNIYLNSMNKQKNFKYELIQKDGLNKYYTDSVFYSKRLQLSQNYFNNYKLQILDSSKSYSEISNILILYGLEKKFLEKNKHWFDERNFQKKYIAPYVLYFRK